MPTTPIPHCVKVELRHIIDAQNVWNTFYAQCTAEPTEAEVIDMANAAITAWSGSWQALLPENAELVEVVATSLTGLDGARAVALVDPPLFGTKTSQQVALNATIAIKRNTGHRGKGRNGRVYWPALCEDQVTGDQVEAGPLAAIVTACQAMGTGIADGGPAGTVDVVAHQHGSRAGTSDPVLSYTFADDYIDSQVDRLPRHKRHKKRSNTSPPP